ncbi:hypothetical protein NM208_g2935 [Fusarium decemcellulare]|uniref:Uncharacterized protein n=1 Tax=Fusarium decemcellulare TaxID=57161 RepID=A0ACC1SQQ7_9HYPO|nr:hypothetical protein NM208_g2935 [Fusarium decemcellulare]
MPIDALVTSVQLSAFGVNFHHACSHGILVEYPTNTTSIQCIGPPWRTNQKKAAQWYILHQRDSYDALFEVRNLENMRRRLQRKVISTSAFQVNTASYAHTRSCAVTSATERRPRRSERGMLVDLQEGYMMLARVHLARNDVLYINLQESPTLRTEYPVGP